MTRDLQEFGIPVAETGDGVYRYRGIRYAAPPTGPGRFRPPLPWTGARPAGQAQAAAPGGAQARPALAPQGPSRLAHVMGPLPERPQSEDCLTVEVVCPQPAGACSRLLPVLVWLLGGGWSSGGGDLPWYDAASLVRQGPMLVVCPNVRLGALGYLAADGLSDGNLGLLDQEAVLRWVQQHIELLGGDPEAVTVMGQSAGGSAVAQLLVRRRVGLSLAADGQEGASGRQASGQLFQRAILQSAALGVRPYEPVQARRLGQRALEALAVPPQQASVDQWLAVQRQAGAWARAQGLASGPVHPPFGPVADGVVLPAAAAYEQALDQAAGEVDVLLGYNRHKLAAFEAPAASQGPDPWFAAPARRWSQRAAQQGRRAWLYQFDWAPQGSPLGACHCIELPFVFDSFEAFEQAPMLAGAGPKEQARRSRLSRQVRQAWINFIVSGDPNQGPASGLPVWPAVAVGRRPVMHLDTLSHCTDGAPGRDLG